MCSIPDLRGKHVGVWMCELLNLRLIYDSTTHMQTQKKAMNLCNWELIKVHVLIIKLYINNSSLLLALHSPVPAALNNN